MDFSFETTIAAPRETVWDVVTDHRRYTEFTPLRTSKLEAEGDPPPNGVGAIRALGIVGPPVREQVTAFEPPRRFAYRLVSGAPLKNHCGEIVLEEAPGRTRISYSIHTEPKYPVIGHLALPISKQSVKSLFDGIKAESERRARG